VDLHGSSLCYLRVKCTAISYDLFQKMEVVWWPMPVILATWEGEAKIRRIMNQGEPSQIVLEIPSPKQPEQNGLET
jgi:hypothetical protein